MAPRFIIANYAFVSVAVASHFLQAMLARFAKTPPTGPGWIHEIKHDGFRMLARRDGEKFRLISRNGNDLTSRFPFAVQALVALPVRSCIIDGEVIVSDSTGLADFQLDQRLSQRALRDALCVRPHRARWTRLALATDRAPQGCPRN